MKAKQPMRFSASLSLIALSIASAHAASPSQSRLFNRTDLPLPNIFVEGRATSGIVGNADALVPLFGMKDNYLSFADLNLQADNHGGYLVSPGAGARFLRNNKIAGAYLFTDFTSAIHGGNFLVINPGVEWIMQQVDLHANFYFPTHHRRNDQSAYYLSDAGNYSHSYFVGHGYFDQQLQQYNLVGNGFDLIAGVTVPIKDHKTYVYAGGYHYDVAHAKNINGLQAGFDYQLGHHLSTGIVASSDAVNHFRAALTLRYSFGKDNAVFSNDVSERMNDSVQRHLGTTNSAGTIVSQHYTRTTGQQKTLRTDVFHFLPGSSGNTGAVDFTQCTFEHPCAGFSQATINSISSLTGAGQLFLAPGNYTFDSTNMILLNPGQGVFGRSSDFITSAQGSQRATVNSGFILAGNNTLDSLQIINNSVAAQLANSKRIGLGDYLNTVTGVDIPSSSFGTNLINNTSIDVAGGSSSDAVAISMEGNNNLTLSNSTLGVKGSNASSILGARGMVLAGAGNVTINGDNITVTNTLGGNALGIDATGSKSRNLSLTDSTLTVSDNSSGAIGLTANNPVTIVGSKINVLELAADSNISTITGILVKGTANVTVKDSTVDVNSVGLSSVAALAVQDSGVLNVVDGSIINAEHNNLLSTLGNTALDQLSGSSTVSNSTLTSSSQSGGGSVGVYAEGGTLNLTGDTINALSTNTTSAGAFANALRTTGLGNIQANIKSTVFNSTNNSSVSGLASLSLSNTNTASLLTLQDVTINAVNQATTAPASVYALYEYGAENLNIDNLKIIASGAGDANGIRIQGSTGATDIKNSNITITASGTTNVYGVYLQNTSGATSIKNSSINVTATGTPSNVIGIIYSGLNAQDLIVQDTALKISSLNTSVTGMIASGTSIGTLRLISDDLEVKSFGASTASTATGLYAVSNGKINDNGSTYVINSKAAPARGVRLDNGQITVLNSNFTEIKSETGQAVGFVKFGNTGSGIVATNTNINVLGNSNSAAQLGTPVVTREGGTWRVNGNIIPESSKMSRHTMKEIWKNYLLDKSL